MNKQFKREGVVRGGVVRHPVNIGDEISRQVYGDYTDQSGFHGMS